MVGMWAIQVFRNTLPGLPCRKFLTVSKQVLQDELTDWIFRRSKDVVWIIRRMVKPGTALTKNPEGWLRIEPGNIGVHRNACRRQRCGVNCLSTGQHFKFLSLLQAPVTNFSIFIESLL